MYLALKYSHMVLALISFLFFLIRALWAFQDSAYLQRRWIKISPHVIDTVLLFSAFALMINLQQYPFAQGWLTGKLLGLLAYIIFASFVIKYAKHNRQRTIYLLLAMLSFAYILLTARNHDALFFI